MGLWRRPPRDTVRCALLARPEIPRGCGAASAWPSYRRSPSSRRAQLPWVGAGTIPDLRGCPLSQAWPPSACAQSGRWARASGRAPRGCGEPWASGSATHAGLDPLAGHARGIDRGLGYHGGGALSAPRVQDLDHASTMRMAPRSSESWSKIPTAVPSRPATPRPAPLTDPPRSPASPTLMRRRSRARAPLATLVRAHLRAGRWGCRSREGSVRKPFDDILGVPLEARFPISVAHA